MHTNNQGANSTSIVIAPSSGQMATSTTPAIVVTGTSSASPPINSNQSAFAAAVSAPHSKAANIEKAVYSYIRAIRVLKRTSVTTLEVAQALGVTPADVEATLESLARKGVKVA